MAPSRYLLFPGISAKDGHRSVNKISPHCSVEYLIPMVLMLFFRNSDTVSVIVDTFLTLALFGLLCYSTEANPSYSSHGCRNGSFSETSITYQSNLNLLSFVITNASLHDGFYTTILAQGTPEAVGSLFLCSGDVTASLCPDCVTAAAKEVIHRCPNQTESIIWYDVCMLRYSNTSFNSIIPSADLSDPKNIDVADQDRFDQLLVNLLNDFAAKVTNSQSGKKKFVTEERQFTMSPKLYGLAQCTLDLLSFDCNMCFRSAIAAFPNYCNGKQGATVLLPGCNVRYELYLFYNVTMPVVSPRSGRRNNSMIVAIVVPLVAFVALFIQGYFILHKRANKCNEILKDGNENDLSTTNSLQYDLATIEATTNKFSDEKIGQGGFGVVYKGTLPGGQDIAMKRLSGSFVQGAAEFRNEVALLAKLQHRNLVRLLRSCLGGYEKILVFEYIPNQSLDHFLFGVDF